eukprot:SAG31_NODE_40767_length_279_cov_0.577778_1_plen_72_part_01
MQEGFRKRLQAHFHPDEDILFNKNRMSERSKLGDVELPTALMHDVSNTYMNIAKKITGAKQHFVRCCNVRLD